jgi:hypothetical protein
VWAVAIAGNENPMPVINREFPSQRYSADLGYVPACFPCSISPARVLYYVIEETCYTACVSRPVVPPGVGWLHLHFWSPPTWCPRLWDRGKWPLKPTRPVQVA